MCRKGQRYSFDGDEDPTFLGLARPRSQSLPKSISLSSSASMSFTQRPTLLPTLTRNVTGSGSLPSGGPQRLLLHMGMIAACLSVFICIYFYTHLSRPARSASPLHLETPEVPPEPPVVNPQPSSSLYTVADVIMRPWTGRNATATATAGTQDETGPRVALCFFGLSRSLTFTMPSIEANLLRPLRESGYRPTVFLHTYNDSSLDEQSKQTQADEWKLLNPFQFLVTSQEEFLTTHRCRSLKHAMCIPESCLSARLLEIFIFQLLS
jgi:hypothetical protein